jgi:hypothetical protein
MKVNPKTFFESDRFISKAEVKEKFVSGRVILRHNYSKRKFKRADKKKGDRYYHEFLPRSKILRVYDL